MEEILHDIMREKVFQQSERQSELEILNYCLKKEKKKKLEGKKKQRNTENHSAYYQLCPWSLLAHD